MAVTTHNPMAIHSLDGWANVEPFRPEATPACRGVNPAQFFDTTSNAGTERAAIERYCKRCDALQECREYAMHRPYLVGAWGGFTRKERAYERKRRGMKTIAGRGRNPIGPNNDKPMDQ